MNSGTFIFVALRAQVAPATKPSAGLIPVGVAPDLKNEYPGQVSPDESIAKKLIENGAVLYSEKYPGQS
ncbi:MAG: hypothetical protein AAF629_28020, partial [Chloroflexota bacterium]